MKQEIISIANQKGGVGKTTTALNIAAGLVNTGKKVLCIDLDPQANLSEYMSYEPQNGVTINTLMQAVVANKPVSPKDAIRKNSEGIDYIPADISLSGADLFLTNAFCREQVLKKVLEHESLSTYEYIIIDCLPSLGVLLTNALTASTSLIIPVQTQKFACDGLDALLQVYQMVKENVNPRLTVRGILLTMVDGTNSSKQIIHSLEEKFNSVLFETKINRSVEAVKSSEMQKSLISQSGSRLGGQYSEVVKEILERCR